MRFFALMMMLISSISMAQDADSSSSQISNHGVSQGCEGSGCTYSSPSSRRRARMRFAEEEMPSTEELDKREKPNVKIQPPEDSF